MQSWGKASGERKGLFMDVRCRSPQGSHSRTVIKGESCWGNEDVVEAHLQLNGDVVWKWKSGRLQTWCHSKQHLQLEFIFPVWGTYISIFLVSSVYALAYINRKDYRYCSPWLTTGHLATIWRLPFGLLMTWIVTKLQALGNMATFKAVCSILWSHDNVLQ